MSPPEQIVPFFIARVRLVYKDIERLVEKHFFTFPPGNLVPPPILMTVRLVPFKSRELRQERHEAWASFLYMTNIYVQARKSRGSVPGGCPARDLSPTLKFCVLL